MCIAVDLFKLFSSFASVSYVWGKRKKKKERRAQMFIAYMETCSFFSCLVRSEKAVHMLRGSQGYNSGEERIENRSNGKAESVEDR